MLHKGITAACCSPRVPGQQFSVIAQNASNSIELAVSSRTTGAGAGGQGSTRPRRMGDSTSGVRYASLFRLATAQERGMVSTGCLSAVVTGQCRMWCAAALPPAPPRPAPPKMTHYLALFCRCHDACLCLLFRTSTQRLLLGRPIGRGQSLCFHHSRHRRRRRNLRCAGADQPTSLAARWWVLLLLLLLLSYS